MISLVSECGARPSVTFTVVRTASAWGPTPRTRTLAWLASPVRLARSKLPITTSSASTSATPPGPRTSSGSAENRRTWSMETRLVASLVAPSRTARKLSGEPFLASVSRTPFESISTAAKTSTTRVRPTRVTITVTGRRERLRTL